MSTVNAEQNLLFGFIALQNGLLSREDLISATSAWLHDKSQPLEELLVARGLLSEGDCEMLAPLVRRHLAQHEGNAEKSLAAIDAVSSVREELRSLGDRDLEASLIHVSSARRAESEVTRTIPWSSSPDPRYQVLRPLAKGGLGLVSVALDDELKREVAFKEIQREYAHDTDSRARFVREAEITGGLEHPGIVPVYGLGQYQDGRPYYAMRMVKGENLRDAINRYHDTSSQPVHSGERSLALRQLLDRFMDVCNAVEYAHSRGVLHRDIKPANIMLGKYGETLVVDWGLAKPIGRNEEHRSKGEETLQPMSGGDSSRTRLGSAIGTPSFMSPEQAAGRLDDLGPQSDVYSLGATLYCILTGRPPLHETGAGTAIRRAQTGDFPKPREVKREVPAGLEAICVRAMALDPTERYQSAAAVSADIECWLADEPVRAYREPLTERVARFNRRHRSWVRAGAAASLLVTVCLIVALVYTNGQRQEAEENLYRSLINEARMGRLARQPGYHLESWDLIRQAMSLRTPVEDRRQLRDEAVASLGDFIGQPSPIVAFDSSLHGLGVDFKGDRIALVKDGGTISVRETTSGAEVSKFETLEKVGSVHFLNDGTLVTLSTSSLTFWRETDAGWSVGSRQVLSGKWTSTGTANISMNIPSSLTPDKRYLAVVEGNESGERVSVWDLPESRKIKSIPANGACRSVAISPDGQWVLLSSVADNGESIAEVWTLKSDQPIHELKPGFGTPHSTSVNRDGSRAAISFQDGIVVYETEGFQPVFTRKAYCGESVAFHPERPLVAVSTKSQGVVLFAYSVDKQLATWSYEARPAFIAFSGNGEALIAAGGYSCYIYRVTTAEKLELEGHTVNASGVAFSPDGQRLASTGHDRVAKVWDAATGRLLNTFEVALYSNLVAFHPAGRLLATGGDTREAISIWDSVTGKQVTEVEWHSWGVEFSPDGRYLAVCGNSGVRIWRVTGADQDDNYAQIRFEPVPSPELPHEDAVGLHLTFSPDSTLLAWVWWVPGDEDANDGLRIWNLDESRAVASPPNRLAAWAWRSVSFFPDSRRLVFFNHAKRGTPRVATVWDIENDQSAFEFEASEQRLDRPFCFSCLNPNGHLLATHDASSRAVEIWDVRVGQRLLSLPQQQSEVWGMDWSPDGTRLAVARSDGNTAIWNLPGIRRQLAELDLAW